MKRSFSATKESLSPPTTKRRLESTTTSKAVASFFKPASQKEPEALKWRIVDNSLLIGRYADPSKHVNTPNGPVKVAAFDFDDTLIAPNTSNRWVRSPTSWKWWDTSVPGRLKELYAENYTIVILSNQGGISLKDNAKSLQKDKISVKNFKDQVLSVLRQLDFPVSIYAATEQDRYRKPRTGMWEEMKEDFDLETEGSIDKTNSFYVGDAGGRSKNDKRRQDHATSDRDLAANIGIPYHTPEEFFLSSEPEPYLHNFEPRDILTAMAATTSKVVPFKKLNVQDLVMFCGSPGAGKSTFFWTVLKPLGYERVNQDILKTRDRCIKTAQDLLREGSSVAVDNTNADPETRAHWVQVARSFRIPIRCVLFTASARLCEHNDAVRAHNKSVNPENRTILPGIAFRSFVQRFRPPKLEEGFQDISTVEFEFKGTNEERETWSRYWVSKFST